MAKKIKDAGKNAGKDTGKDANVKSEIKPETTMVTGTATVTTGTGKPVEKKTVPVSTRKPQIVKPPSVQEKENFRGIVRIAGKDMKGELPLRRALAKVRGIGHTMAASASVVLKRELSLGPEARIGEFDDELIEKVDKILTNLHEYNIPHYLFNRNCDFVSGAPKHVIMTDLLFEVQQDVDREKKLNTWKGFRHTYGQKVRGQKTRNTGRTGMAVGVLRKTVLAAAGAAAVKQAGGTVAPAAGGAAGVAKDAGKKAPAAKAPATAVATAPVKK